MVSGVTKPTSRPLGVDHADRGRRLFLQHAERLVERAAVADKRQRAGHRFRHPGVGAALLDGADQIVAAEHADRMVGGVDHREFALAGAQQRLDRLVDGASGGSVANWVIIAAATGTPRDIARIATSCASEAAAR